MLFDYAMRVRYFYAVVEWKFIVAVWCECNDDVLSLSLVSTTDTDHNERTFEFDYNECDSYVRTYTPPLVSRCINTHNRLHANEGFNNCFMI